MDDLRLGSSPLDRDEPLRRLIRTNDWEPGDGTSQNVWALDAPSVARTAQGALFSFCSKF